MAQAQRPRPGAESGARPSEEQVRIADETLRRLAQPRGETTPLQARLAIDAAHTTVSRMEDSARTIAQRLQMPSERPAERAASIGGLMTDLRSRITQLREHRIPTEGTDQPTQQAIAQMDRQRSSFFQEIERRVATITPAVQRGDTDEAQRTIAGIQSALHHMERTLHIQSTLASSQGSPTLMQHIGVSPELALRGEENRATVLENIGEQASRRSATLMSAAGSTQLGRLMTLAGELADTSSHLDSAQLTQATRFAADIFQRTDQVTHEQLNYFNQSLMAQRQALSELLSLQLTDRVKEQIRDILRDLDSALQRTTGEGHHEMREDEVRTLSRRVMEVQDFVASLTDTSIPTAVRGQLETLYVGALGAMKAGRHATADLLSMAAQELRNHAHTAGREARGDSAFRTEIMNLANAVLGAANDTDRQTAERALMTRLAGSLADGLQSTAGRIGGTAGDALQALAGPLSRGTGLTVDALRMASAALDQAKKFADYGAALARMPEDQRNGIISMFTRGIQALQNGNMQAARVQLQLTEACFRRGVTDTQRSEYRQLSEMLGRNPRAIDTVRQYMELDSQITSFRGNLAHLGPRSQERQLLETAIASLEQARARLAQTGMWASEDQVTAQVAALRLRLPNDQTLQREVQTLMRQLRQPNESDEAVQARALQLLASREANDSERRRVGAVEQTISTFFTSLGKPGIRRVDLTQIFSFAFQQLAGGNLTDGESFRLAGEAYSGLTSSRDREDLLAIVQQAGTAERDPGARRFDPVQLRQLAVYHQWSQHDRQITNPALHNNARAFFDLALIAARGSNATEADNMLDMAIAYAGMAAIRPERLSADARIQRQQTMDGIVERLGDYSRLGSRRLIDIGTEGRRGWTPREGQFGSPIARALTSGRTVSEGLGEQAAELPAALAGRLGRQPTADELASARAEEGGRRLQQLGTFAEGATRAVDDLRFDQRCGDALGTRTAAQETRAERRYNRESERLGRLAAQARERGDTYLAEYYDAEAGRVDRAFITQSIASARQIYSQGQQELTASVALAREADQSTTADVPRMRARIQELRGELSPSEQRDLDQMMRQAGDNQPAMREIYSGLLRVTAQRRREHGQELVADAGRILDGVGQFDRSVQRVTTRHREGGRRETSVGIRVLIAVANNRDVTLTGDEPPQQPAEGGAAPRASAPPSQPRLQLLRAHGRSMMALGQGEIEAQERIQRTRDTMIASARRDIRDANITRLSGFIERLAREPAPGGPPPMIADAAARQRFRSELTRIRGISDFEQRTRELQSLYQQASQAAGVPTQATPATGFGRAPEEPQQLYDGNRVYRGYRSTEGLAWAERFDAARAQSASARSEMREGAMLVGNRMSERSMRLQLEQSRGGRESGFIISMERVADLRAFPGLANISADQMAMEGALRITPELLNEAISHLPADRRAAMRARLQSAVTGDPQRRDYELSSMFFDLNRETIPVPDRPGQPHRERNLMEIVISGSLVYYDADEFEDRILAARSMRQRGSSGAASTELDAVGRDMMIGEAAQSRDIERVRDDHTRWVRSGQRGGPRTRLTRHYQGPSGEEENTRARGEREDINALTNVGIQDIEASFDRADGYMRDSSSANERARDEILRTREVLQITPDVMNEVMDAMPAAMRSRFSDLVDRLDRAQTTDFTSETSRRAAVALYNAVRRDPEAFSASVAHMRQNPALYAGMVPIMEQLSADQTTFQSREWDRQESRARQIGEEVLQRMGVALERGDLGQRTRYLTQSQRYYNTQELLGWSPKGEGYRTPEAHRADALRMMEFARAVLKPENARHGDDLLVRNMEITATGFHGFGAAAREWHGDRRFELGDTRHEGTEYSFHVADQLAGLIGLERMEASSYLDEDAMPASRQRYENMAEMEIDDTFRRLGVDRIDHHDGTFGLRRFEPEGEQLRQFEESSRQLRGLLARMDTVVLGQRDPSLLLGSWIGSEEERYVARIEERVRAAHSAQYVAVNGGAAEDFNRHMTDSHPFDSRTGEDTDTRTTAALGDIKSWASYQRAAGIGVDIVVIAATAVFAPEFLPAVFMGLGAKGMAEGYEMREQAGEWTGEATFSFAMGAAGVALVPLSEAAQAMRAAAIMREMAAGGESAFQIADEALQLGFRGSRLTAFMNGTAAERAIMMEQAQLLREGGEVAIRGAGETAQIIRAGTPEAAQFLGQSSTRLGSIAARTGEYLVGQPGMTAFQRAVHLAGIGMMATGAVQFGRTLPRQLEAWSRGDVSGLELGLGAWQSFGQFAATGIYAVRASGSAGPSAGYVPRWQQALAAVTLGIPMHPGEVHVAARDFAMAQRELNTMAPPDRTAYREFTSRHGIRLEPADQVSILRDFNDARTSQARERPNEAPLTFERYMADQSRPGARQLHEQSYESRYQAYREQAAEGRMRPEDLTTDMRAYAEARAGGAEPAVAVAQADAQARAAPPPQQPAPQQAPAQRGGRRAHVTARLERAVEARRLQEEQSAFSAGLDAQFASRSTSQGPDGRAVTTYTLGRGSTTATFTEPHVAAAREAVFHAERLLRAEPGQRAEVLNSIPESVRSAAEFLSGDAAFGRATLAEGGQVRPQPDRAAQLRAGLEAAGGLPQFRGDAVVTRSRIEMQALKVAEMRELQPSDLEQFASRYERRAQDLRASEPATADSWQHAADMLRAEIRTRTPAVARPAERPATMRRPQPELRLPEGGREEAAAQPPPTEGRRAPAPAEGAPQTAEQRYGRAPETGDHSLEGLEPLIADQPTEVQGVARTIRRLASSDTPLEQIPQEFREPVRLTREAIASDAQLRATRPQRIAEAARLAQADTPLNQVPAQYRDLVGLARIEARAGRDPRAFIERRMSEAEGRTTQADMRARSDAQDIVAARTLQRQNAGMERELGPAVHELPENVAEDARIIYRATRDMQMEGAAQARAIEIFGMEGVGERIQPGMRVQDIVALARQLHPAPVERAAAPDIAARRQTAAQDTRAYALRGVVESGRTVVAGSDYGTGVRASNDLWFQTTGAVARGIAPREQDHAVTAIEGVILRNEPVPTGEGEFFQTNALMGNGNSDERGIIIMSRRPRDYQGAVSDVRTWIASERAAGREPSPEAIRQRIEFVTRAQGPQIDTFTIAIDKSGLGDIDRTTSWHLDAQGRRVSVTMGQDAASVISRELFGDMMYRVGDILHATAREHGGRITTTDIDAAMAQVRAEVMGSRRVPDRFVEPVAQVRDRLRALDITERESATREGRGFRPISRQHEHDAAVGVLRERLHHEPQEREISELLENLHTPDPRTYHAQVGPDQARGGAPRTITLEQYATEYLGRGSEMLAAFAHGTVQETIRPGDRQGADFGRAYERAEERQATYTHPLARGLGIPTEGPAVVTGVDEHGIVRLPKSETIPEGSVVAEVRFRLSSGSTEGGRQVPGGREIALEQLRDHIHAAADLGATGRSRAERVQAIRDEFSIGEREATRLLDAYENNSLTTEMFFETVPRKGILFATGEWGFSEGNTALGHYGMNNLAQAVADVAARFPGVRFAEDNLTVVFPPGTSRETVREFYRLVNERMPTTQHEGATVRTIEAVGSPATLDAATTVGAFKSRSAAEQLGVDPGGVEPLTYIVHGAHPSRRDRVYHGIFGEQGTAVMERYGDMSRPERINAMGRTTGPAREQLLLSSAVEEIRGNRSLRRPRDVLAVFEQRAQAAEATSARARESGDVLGARRATNEATYWREISRALRDYSVQHGQEYISRYHEQAGGAPTGGGPGGGRTTTTVRTGGTVTVRPAEGVPAVAQVGTGTRGAATVTPITAARPREAPPPAAAREGGATVTPITAARPTARETPQVAAREYEITTPASLADYARRVVQGDASARAEYRQMNAAARAEVRRLVADPEFRAAAERPPEGTANFAYRRYLASHDAGLQGAARRIEESLPPRREEARATGTTGMAAPADTVGAQVLPLRPGETQGGAMRTVAMLGERAVPAQVVNDLVTRYNSAGSRPVDASTPQGHDVARMRQLVSAGMEPRQAARHTLEERPPLSASELSQHAREIYDVAEALLSGDQARREAGAAQFQQMGEGAQEAVSYLIAPGSEYVNGDARQRLLVAEMLGGDVTRELEGRAPAQRPARERLEQLAEAADRLAHGDDQARAQARRFLEQDSVFWSTTEARAFGRFYRLMSASRSRLPASEYVNAYLAPPHQAQAAPQARAPMPERFTSEQQFRQYVDNIPSEVVYDGNHVTQVRNSRQVIAIGDVHGDVYGLVDQLVRAGVLEDTMPNLDLRDASVAPQRRFVLSRSLPRNSDVVFLGDYIDRGHHSLEVIDLVRQVQHEASSRGVRVHAIRGNHEQLFLRFAERYRTWSTDQVRQAIEGTADIEALADGLAWGRTGIAQTFESIIGRYGSWENFVSRNIAQDGSFIPGSELEFVNHTRGAVIIDNNYFTHAGPVMSAGNPQELDAHFTNLFSNADNHWAYTIIGANRGGQLYHGAIRNRDYSASYVGGSDSWHNQIESPQGRQWMHGMGIDHIYVGHARGNEVRTVGSHVTNLDAGMSEAYGGGNGILVIDPAHPTMPVRVRQERGAIPARPDLRVRGRDAVANGDVDFTNIELGPGQVVRRSRSDVLRNEVAEAAERFYRPSHDAALGLGEGSLERMGLAPRTDADGTLRVVENNGQRFHQFELDVGGARIPISLPENVTGQQLIDALSGMPRLQRTPGTAHTPGEWEGAVGPVAWNTALEPQLRQRAVREENGVPVVDPQVYRSQKPFRNVARALDAVASSHLPETEIPAEYLPAVRRLRALPGDTTAEARATAIVNEASGIIAERARAAAPQPAAAQLTTAQQGQVRDLVARQGMSQPRAEAYVRDRAARPDQAQLGADMHGIPQDFYGRDVPVIDAHGRPATAALRDAPRAQITGVIDNDTGAGGGVYRGRVMVNGQPTEVAVKVFRDPEPHRDTGVRDWEGNYRYMLREAQNLQALSQITIRMPDGSEVPVGPRTYGVVNVDGNYAIAMDIIPGRAIEDMSGAEVRSYVTPETYRQLGAMWDAVVRAGYSIGDFQFAVLTRDAVVGGVQRHTGDVVFWDAGGMSRLGPGEQPRTAAQIVDHSRGVADITMGWDHVADLRTRANDTNLTGDQRLQAQTDLQMLDYYLRSIFPDRDPATPVSTEDLLRQLYMGGRRDPPAPGQTEGRYVEGLELAQRFMDSLRASHPQDVGRVEDALRRFETESGIPRGRVLPEPPAAAQPRAAPTPPQAAQPQARAPSPAQPQAVQASPEVAGAMRDYENYLGMRQRGGAVMWTPEVRRMLELIGSRQVPSDPQARATFIEPLARQAVEDVSAARSLAAEYQRQTNMPADHVRMLSPELSRMYRIMADAQASGNALQPYEGAMRVVAELRAQGSPLPGAPRPAAPQAQAAPTPRQGRGQEPLPIRTLEESVGRTQGRPELETVLNQQSRRSGVGADEQRLDTEVRTVARVLDAIRTYPATRIPPEARDYLAAHGDLQGVTDPLAILEQARRIVYRRNNLPAPALRVAPPMSPRAYRQALSSVPDAQAALVRQHFGSSAPTQPALENALLILGDRALASQHGVFGSFWNVLMGESMGGNAGPGNAAVNGYYDPGTGRIIAFGNIQNIPAGIRARGREFTLRVEIATGRISVVAGRENPFLMALDGMVTHSRTQ